MEWVQKNDLYSFFVVFHDGVTMNKLIIKKSIQLTTKPLEELIAQEEAIDFRLDEKAWKDLKTGDIIEFWEDFSGWDKKPSEKARRVPVKIKSIIKASNFSELIDILSDSFLMKGSDKEKILSELRKWWTPEKEQEMGVIGFRVTKI